MTSAFYGGLAALNLGTAVYNLSRGDAGLAVVAFAIGVFLTIAAIDARRGRR